MYTWTGNQVVNDQTWLNYFALPGMTKTPGGTAAITIEEGNLKFPVRTRNTQVMFSVRISGTIAGGAGTAREWRTQTRRTHGQLERMLLMSITGMIKPLKGALHMNNSSHFCVTISAQLVTVILGR